MKSQGGHADRRTGAIHPSSGHPQYQHPGPPLVHRRSASTLSLAGLRVSSAARFPLIQPHPPLSTPSSTALPRPLAPTPTPIALYLLSATRYSLPSPTSPNPHRYVKHNERLPFVIRAWGTALRLLQGRQPAMYDIQRALPHLPVPTLKKTCERYVHLKSRLPR